MDPSRTIAAPATGHGGAIAMIRVSGKAALDATDSIFLSPAGRKVSDAAGYTMLFGTVSDGDRTVDEVVVCVYRAPQSYTGEDMTEICCHASDYIVSEILRLLAEKGVSAAGPGEFTMRAFMNGRIPLDRAEAVADVIASHDRASHFISMQQMRGGYTEDLRAIREHLLETVSLLELELDFGEEDVQFASRERLNELIQSARERIGKLCSSFSQGNAIRRGIPIVIAGKPNTGKSTLLNKLLNDSRAIVSDIAGTTRDTIEDILTIDGTTFRITDTAGLHDSEDVIEKLGIERTIAAIGRSSIVLVVSDRPSPSAAELAEDLAAVSTDPDQKVCLLLNKTDINHIGHDLPDEIEGIPVMPISAKTGEGLESVRKFISESAGTEAIYSRNVTVSNLRHYEALSKAADDMERAANGIDEHLDTELIVEDIRSAIANLGSITGEISSTDILENIFKNFCIGK